MAIYRRNIVALFLVSLLALAVAFTFLVAVGWAWSIMEYDQFPIAVGVGALAGVIPMGIGLKFLRSAIDLIENILDLMQPN